MNFLKTISYTMLLGLGVAGCSVGPNYHAPKIAPPTSFANTNDTQFTTNNAISQWWRGFNDPKLDQLVQLALSSNLDLKIATANLRQARAIRSGAIADFFPTVTGVADYTHTRYSTAATFNAPGFPREQNLYDAGFDASWELDIFGRVRRSVEAANASLQSFEASRRDVQISLLSEVARNYFDVRGAQNELLVLNKNATNQTETLKITQARLEGGAGTDLDVARARAQLNNTLAAIPPLEATLTRALHRLSVLTGRNPTAIYGELDEPSASLEFPTTVSIGDPAALLRRRPDVRIAERNLAAATARIGVSVADLFPRVTFNGTLALQSTSFTGLWKPGADAHSFGPSISWAALDLGHVRARIIAAKAVADSELALYEKTVLTSLEETENALSDFGRQRARSAYLTESVKASEQAARLARDRYDNGATDFLTVLDAERVLLEAQDSLAQTQTQTFDALIAVYKALGGGWEQEN